MTLLSKVLIASEVGSLGADGVTIVDAIAAHSEAERKAATIWK